MKAFDLETTVTSAEQRIVGEIGKFLENHLLPIIDQKADKTDIDRIESLPTIAHELKSKK